MLYVLWREDVVDEQGEPWGYFHLNPCDLDVLDQPWEQGVQITLAPDAMLDVEVVPDSEARCFADYVFGGVPLFSQRLRQVLDAVGVANVRYVPTRVRNGADFPGVPDYVAPSIVGLVSVVDEQASVIRDQPFGGHGATTYSKLVVRAQAGGLPDVFRLRENTGTIVVSQRVVDACRAAGVATLRFVPLPDWTE